MALNEKEAKVLGKIRDNPYISQKELSEYVDLSRSTVANIISGLVQKGYLVGRAYVVNEDRPVVCIGGANIDRLYVVEGALIQGTSNQVTSRTNVGGIARNIGENLGKLEIPAVLLSMTGKDEGGETIRSLSKPYMNIDYMDETGLCATGNFTEITDSEGNLKLGLAEMAIYDQITPKWLHRYRDVIEKSSYVVVDTNLPQDTFESLLGMASRLRLKVALITTSIQKLSNIPDCVEGLTMLVTKHDETAFHFGMDIEDENMLEEGIRRWQDAGVKKVMIVKNNEKVAYSASKEDAVHLFSNPKKNRERYAWGGVEALTAGWIYGKYRDKTDEEALIYGLVNSFETTQNMYSVRQNLSQKILQRDFQDFLKSKTALPENFKVKISQ